MARQHHPWLEGAEDAGPVVRREAPARDAGQEDVDPAMADLRVEQVRTALVVEGLPGHLDVDAPDLPALVGRRRERVEVLAGQLAV
jgi:hypothetical protein